MSFIVLLFYDLWILVVETWERRMFPPKIPTVFYLFGGEIDLKLEKFGIDILPSYLCDIWWLMFCVRPSNIFLYFYKKHKSWAFDSISIFFGKIKISLKVALTFLTKINSETLLGLIGNSGSHWEKFWCIQTTGYPWSVILIIYLSQ